MTSELEELKNRILPVLRRHDVARAGIFGSVVRGEAGEASDVDIAVEFAGEKSLLDLVGLQLELEEVCGRRVDVSTYASLHPRIRGRVLTEQVVLL